MPTPALGEFLFLLIVKQSETHVCRTLHPLPTTLEVPKDILHTGQGHQQQNLWVLCQQVPSLVLKHFSLVNSLFTSINHQLLLSSKILLKTFLWGERRIYAKLKIPALGSDPSQLCLVYDL